MLIIWHWHFPRQSGLEIIAPINRLFLCNVAGAAVLINSHVVQFHIVHLRHVVSFYKNESQITPTDQNLHAFSFSCIKCDVFELQIWQLCLLMSPLTWKCEKDEEWMSEKNWHSLHLVPTFIARIAGVIHGLSVWASDWAKFGTGEGVSSKFTA